RRERIGFLAEELTRVHEQGVRAKLARVDMGRIGQERHDREGDSEGQQGVENHVREQRSQACAYSARPAHRTVIHHSTLFGSQRWETARCDSASALRHAWLTFSTR